jgi:hypothetical protein
MLLRSDADGNERTVAGAGRHPAGRRRFSEERGGVSTEAAICGHHNFFRAARDLAGLQRTVHANDPGLRRFTLRTGSARRSWPALRATRSLRADRAHRAKVSGGSGFALGPLLAAAYDAKRYGHDEAKLGVVHCVPSKEHPAPHTEVAVTPACRKCARSNVSAIGGMLEARTLPQDVQSITDGAPPRRNLTAPSTWSGSQRKTVAAQSRPVERKECVAGETTTPLKSVTVARFPVGAVDVMASLLLHSIPSWFRVVADGESRLPTRSVAATIPLEKLRLFAATKSRPSASLGAPR